MNIIIHTSDSEFGNAAIITKWHTSKPRNWSNIGYHYVILNGHLSKKAYNKFYDGHIETGRPLDDDNMIEPFEMGAHTKGHNDAVGICLIGKNGEYTGKQYSSLEKVIRQILYQFGSVNIYQHSDFSDEKPNCAGLSIDYMRELKEIYEN